MDCSVKGYLSRRTEAELEAMLRYYIMRKDWKSNLQEIILICEEAHKRQKGTFIESHTEEAEKCR